MMDIVYCTDDNYTMPCGVSIISLLENNRKENFVIHVVGLNLSEKSKSQLIENVATYESVEIKFYEVSEKLFDSYNLSLFGSKYLTVSAYSRLFLSDLLPPTIDKVLYLDCDVIIANDISELWNTQIDDYSIVGMPDICVYEDEEFVKLGYDFNLGYVNSGVLLINLKYWRDKNVVKLFVDFYTKNFDQITRHDQDVINGTFCDTKLLLPIKFNVVDFYYQTKKKDLFGYEEEINDAIKKPVIIHFTTIGKPWLKQCLHPLEKEFLRYKKLSLWSKEPKTWGKATLSQKTKYYKRIVLYTLKIKKPKYKKISLQSLS